MAVLKWTIILLAFHLMGLFDSKAITAAPVYNSEESQNSSMRDSILVNTNDDDDDDDTHEINIHNEGNDDDGVAEKGEDQISTKEGQGVENEKESGVSVNENIDNLSNLHKDGDITTETSDEGERVNHEEAHDQKVDTGLASNDDDNDATHEYEVTGASHNNEVDTMAAHDSEDDTEAAHQDNEDTGASHDNEEDTEAPHEDNEDTGVAHEVEEDTAHKHNDTGEAYEDNEDTDVAHEGEENTAHKHNEDIGEAHEDNDTGAAHEGEEDRAHKHNEDTGEAREDNDTGAGHKGDADTGAVHDEKDTGATHEDNENTGAAQGAEDTGAGNNNEEHTYRKNVHEEDYNADFGTEYVHKENHIAVYTDKGKYTAVSHEVFKEQPTNTSGINENGLAPNVYHEKATAGLVHGAVTQHTNDTVNSDESSEDQNAEGRETVDIHNPYATAIHHLKNDNATYSHVDYERRAGMVDDDDYDDEEEGEEDGDNSDGAKIGNSGVAEDSPRRMLGRKEDKINDINSKKNDSNTDISERKEMGHKYGDKNEDKPGAAGIDTAKNLGEEDDSVSERTHEYNVTKSVTGSENSTVVPGSQLQKEEIRRQGEDGVNELGHEKSEDSEYSKSSTGSFVVLGIIMGTIVVLLAYSVFKSRWRNTQEVKNEDFGTEMVDVKKTLLPRNELNGSVHPTMCPEDNESNAKLLPDTQYKVNNEKNDEIHKAEAEIADYDVQNKKDRNSDSRSKLEIDFDRIETQSELGVTSNTLKSHIEENVKSFPEVVTPKKVETAYVQSRHHPLESKKTPDKTFKSHSEESTNRSPGVVTPKKAETTGVQSAQHLQEPRNDANNAFKASSREGTNSVPKAVTPEKVETADVQSAHDSTHQNGYNNVNGVSEAVVGTQPYVLVQNNCVAANTGGLVAIPDMVQVYNPSLPVTCVTATIVDRQPSSYIIQYTQ
jgi:hypothetical protein